MTLPKNDAVSQFVKEGPEGFVCTWKDCDKPGPFKNAMALRMHVIRKHTHQWSTTNNLIPGGGRKAQPKKGTKAYRKEKYEAQKLRWRAQGLTAQGKPFKNSAISIAMRQHHAQRGTATAGLKPRHYVWPLPGTTDNLDAAPRIKFCPHCGSNLEKHLS
jgi:hypothetical protein